MPKDNPEMYAELKSIAERLMEMANMDGSEESEETQEAPMEAPPASGKSKISTALNMYKE